MSLRPHELICKRPLYVKFLLLPLMIWALSFLASGCTTTLREKKATDTDPGNATQLKVTGPRVKLAYSF